MNPETLRTLVIVVPGVLIAITYHEIAHGWMADRLGDPTTSIRSGRSCCRWACS